MTKSPAVVVAVVACVFQASEVNADGLLYKIPEDGVWASFKMEGSGTEADGTRVTLVGTLTISLVGTTEFEGQRCRWIEVSGESKHNDEAFSDFHKLLIPEEHLGKGKDPLTYVVKAYTTLSQPPEEPYQ